MIKKMITTALLIVTLGGTTIRVTPRGHTLTAGTLSQESLLDLAIAVADTSSIDAVLKALYESITFIEGKEPDLARFRSLFAPEAPCLRVNKDQRVDRMTVDSFILSFRERIRAGTLKSFYESEIARKMQRYGQMAHIFSTYQKGLNASDPTKMIRGINSIQLFFHDGRWWIGSLMWMDERPEMPIPKEYLR